MDANGGGAVDGDAFRRTMSQFPTGVTVVTAVAGGRPHGMTVSAFASVSLEPPMVVVAVHSGARLLPVVRRSRALAVTILSRGQRPVAEEFARPGRPSGPEAFEQVAWRAAPGSGAPVLTDGLAWLDCGVRAMHQAGDHVLCVAEVTALDVLDAQGPPLHWFRSAMS